MFSDEPTADGTHQGEPCDNGTDQWSSTELSIRAIAEQFMADLLAGKADFKQVVSEHPDLAPALEKRLLVVQSLFNVFSSKDDIAAGSFADGLEGSQRGRVADQARRLSCPNCGVRLQIVETVHHADVTCSGCGSNIRVEPGSTRALSSEYYASKIGRFELIELIGRGGFGSVYRARDPDLSREVAIKIPREGYFETLNERARFLREARHAAKLRHPNIVQVHEIAKDDSLPYIVTDYIDGLTLADLINGRRMTFRESAELMVKVAEAIEYAHSQGVIHRDIKPSNILLDHDFSPFIADFGLARDKDENEITLTLDGEVLGTAAYMSPEQARGDVTGIHWTSDVYSMGVVLYKMLAGELPFHGNRRMMISQVLNDEPSSVRRLNEHVPRDLDTITLKAIAKEPKYRYGTAREFADDLRRWLHNEPIVARPETAFGRLRKWYKRRPMVAALSATIALLLLVGTGLSITWAIREAGLREISNKNLSLATENRRQSDARLQKLFVQNGAERLAQSDPLTALAWFDVALNSPNDQHDLHRLRIGRTLAQLPILTHLWDAGARVKHLQYSRDGNIILAITDESQVWIIDQASGEDLVPPIEHQAVVQAATLDPTGTRVAIAAGKQAVVWNIQTNERTAVLEHDEIVISCSFRADGQRLATASVDNIAKIWDLPDGNLQHTLEHTFPEIRMAEFVGGSNNYATVTTNETITESRLVIWNSDTGATLQDSLYPDRIVGMAFNDDGTRAATSSVDRRVAVWDISAGQPIGPGMAHGAPVAQMFFVADDRQLVTVAKQGTIARWRVKTGSQIGDETRLDSAVVDAHISSDDTFIAIAGADGRVQIRWLDSGELVCGQLIHGSTASAIAFHPNNRVFVCSGNDGALKQWDLAGVERSALRLQHDAEVLQARFSPTGDRVVSASRDQTGGLWTAATGERIGNPLGHDLDVLDCDFSANGQFVASASADKTCKVWDAYSGVLIGKPWAHTETVLRVAFTPDSKKVLTATTDGKIYFWEIGQDEPLYSRLCHRNEIWTIAVHPSGDRFATGSSDGEVHVWDIADGSRTGAPLSHEGLISSCRFDDSGQWLAAASRDGTVAVWSMDDLAQSPQLLRHRAAVTSCSFAPGGNRLLTTDSQGGATMWQLDAGRFIKKWHEEFGSYVLTYGQFSPDGCLVVVCGARASSYQWRPRNGVIFLLDSKTATQVSPTMHHLRRVQRVHFSAAGDALVSGSLDYDCRVWAIEPVLMESPDLSHFIQVLSGHVVDERSRVVSVDAGSQDQLFEQLQRVQPELFRSTASQIESWTAHVQHVKRVSAPQLTPDERDQ